MQAIHTFPFSLQLFAEGDGGTGVSASDAGMHSGETAAPDAGVQNRDAEFEALIRGQFKEQYDTRVQETIQKRLKSQKQTLDRYRALTPSLQLLAQRYGIGDHNDVEALNKAIEQDDLLRRGIPDAGPQGSAEERAQARCARWSAQQEEVRKLYPSFNLSAELRDPAFRGLLRSGVDVRAAYEVTHRDEILSGAMRYAAESVRRKLAGGLASSRPMENGMRAQGAALTRQDITQMTRQEREAIRRRVAGGEKIRL